MAPTPSGRKGGAGGGDGIHVTPMYIIDIRDVLVFRRGLITTGGCPWTQRDFSGLHGDVRSSFQFLLLLTTHLDVWWCSLQFPLAGEKGLDPSD